ncbi:MAG: FAD-binding oxidoreductase, partial [Frankia sp.]|nr:FAD-binding oxidoreductase [Frankia sp.]
MAEGTHESYWIDSTPETSYGELPADLTVDVAVLGGGIAGLTTAVLLKRAGKTVAVVEADQIVKGVTGYTTAKVTSQHNLIYDYLVKAFGEDGARIYGESQQAAIERVAAFVADDSIDCDFPRLPHYVYREVDDERSSLESGAATAARLGLPATFVADPPLPYRTVGAVRFDNQAQFHPRKYLLALAQTIPGDGSYVIEGTRATGVDEGDPIVVQTDRGEIRARDVVVATHMPILDRGFYFAKTAPYRDHVVAAAIDAAQAPPGMFISTGAEEFSTHSVRSTPY